MPNYKLDKNAHLWEKIQIEYQVESNPFNATVMIRGNNSTELSILRECMRLRNNNREVKLELSSMKTQETSDPQTNVPYFTLTNRNPLTAQEFINTIALLCANFTIEKAKARALLQQNTQSANQNVSNNNNASAAARNLSEPPTYTDITGDEPQVMINPKNKENIQLWDQVQIQVFAESLSARVTLTGNKLKETRKIRDLMNDRNRTRQGDLILSLVGSRKSGQKDIFFFNISCKEDSEVTPAEFEDTVSKLLQNLNVRENWQYRKTEVKPRKRPKVDGYSEIPANVETANFSTGVLLIPVLPNQVILARSVSLLPQYSLLAANRNQQAANDNSLANNDSSPNPKPN